MFAEPVYRKAGFSLESNAAAELKISAYLVVFSSKSIDLR